MGEWEARFTVKELEWMEIDIAETSFKDKLPTYPAPSLHHVLLNYTFLLFPLSSFWASYQSCYLDFLFHSKLGWYSFKGA